ncbi:Ankyrin-1 [Colletotrichum fructicola]|nr:Ankyrin-1 [Colletotrichum fructicola]KAF4906876.1 Ankyrin-1 [Colletotrichum fructicola]
MSWLVLPLSLQIINHLDHSLILISINRAQYSKKSKKRGTWPNGDVVIVRDVMEKIAGWVQRFKETADAAMQYDPAHAALPWAAFRFLLQTTVSEVQVFSAVVTDLEDIARKLARYRMTEKLHVRRIQSEIDTEVERALVRLYAEILTHLSYAVRFYSERTIARAVKSPFRTVKEDRKKELQDREHEVNQLTTLADAEILRSFDGTFKRFSMQASRLVSEDKFNEIASWLSVAPYYSHHQFIAESRLAGVGQWLLNHQDYTQWLTSSSSSLFYLYGIPGSGKSTLCSVVVDTMISAAGNDPCASPLGYFYCANPEFEKARRSCDDVLRTILFQLSIDSSSRTMVKQFLYSEYERQLARSPAGRFDMVKLRTKDCVRLILELAEEDPITIIIDGLDSIDDDDKYTLIKALDDIVSQADNVVKIFVTSRSSNQAAMIPTAAFKTQITPEATRQDMEAFVKHQIDAALAAKLLLGGVVRFDTRKVLEEALLEGAGEMFLWVKLCMERICRETVEDDVLSALRTKLPESIDQLYQSSLDRISRAGNEVRGLAMKALSWVLHMRKPLTPPALLAALESGQDPTLDAAQLMNICHNLVVLDTQCNVMRFSHQSVQDFLKGHESFAPRTAHNLLASICIEACSRGPVSEHALAIPSDDFYVYAAIYWPVHSKMAQDLCTSGPSPDDASLTQNIISFMFDEDRATTLSFKLWIETVGDIVASLQRSHQILPALSAISESENGFLFVLSTFGLDGALMMVLSQIDSIDTNQRNDIGYTPLHLASTFGHTSTVMILEKYGAKLNVECGKFGSPLHAACFNGHLQVVEKLLELGVDTTCGSNFNTALQAALRGGQEDVAVHLVDHGVAITNEEAYEEAMQGAASVGFVRLVHLLESSKFDILKRESKDKLRKRLLKAIQGGQLEVLRRYFRRNIGTDVLIPPDAVAIATLYNHKDLVEFLLDQKMDVEVEGAFGSPLRTAALLNYRPIVRLLLEKGANINAFGAFGDALQAAGLKEHGSLLKLLIEEGANVNQQTGFYGSALQAAAYRGRLRSVELLLNAKADIHQAGFSKDAFHAAAAGGHEDVIALMLRRGYTYQRDLPRQTCLHQGQPPRYVCLWTAEVPRRQHSRRRVHNHDTNTEFYDVHKAQKPLLDYEVIIGEGHGESETTHSSKQQASQLQDQAAKMSGSLQAAAFAGHMNTVRLLLEHKDTLGISSHEIKLAVEVAEEAGHLSIIQHLIKATKSEEEVRDHIRGMVNRGHAAHQTDVVNFALALASQHLSPDECSRLQETTCTAAETYKTTGRSEEKLYSSFFKSCEAGDVHLMSVILETGDQELLSVRDVEGGLHLCALHSNLAVAQMLLDEPLLQNPNLVFAEEVFVTAAASGSTAFMKLVLRYWPQLLLSSGTTALSHALVKSSENGHIDVVRYLVLDLDVDVNTVLHDKHFDLNWIDGAATGLEFFMHQISGGPRHRAIGPRIEVDYGTVIPKISPLQAVIRGLVKFDPETDLDRNDLVSMHQRHSPPHAEQDQQEQTLAFLLEKGSDPNDLGGQTVYPMQLVAKHGSEYSVDLLISAGADVNVEGHDKNSFSDRSPLGNSHLGSTNNKNAFLAAAGRELSALSIVRKLVAAGANIPRRLEEQHSLLEQALRHFHGDNILGSQTYGSYRSTDGKFIVTPSLEYLFTEGCAGVLLFFLAQMPHVRTTNIQWGLVLQMAAFIGDIKAVDLLLSRGANVNSIGYFYGTALQAASSSGHDKVVQSLLDTGANVNLIAGRWETPLRGSLVAGHEQSVKILLQRGARVDNEIPSSQNGSGAQSWKEAQTDLQLGVATKDAKIVKQLLSKGADPIIDLQEGQHPLIMASGNGSVAIVQDLIQAGAPVNIHGKKRRGYKHFQTEDASPMHAAIANGSLDVVEVLLENGANIDLNIQESGTPLTIAAAEGQASIIRHLLMVGAKDSNSRAFRKAIENNHVETVRVLLEEGAQVMGMLSVACERGHIEIIELLVESITDRGSLKAALDEAFAVEGLKDSVVKVLLCYAAPTAQRFLNVCAVGSPYSVKSMLEQGDIDVNTPTEDGGNLPLQVAALHLNSEAVQVLLEAGAHTECTSAEHGPPLISALEACAAWILCREKDERLKSIVNSLALPEALKPSNHWHLGQGPYTSQSRSFRLKCEAIVELLIDHEANIADVGRPLGSPLHLACLLGSRPMVEKLIQRGCDLDTTVGHFERPIFSAIRGQNADIVLILLKHMPTPNYIHTEYSTPLHYACAVGDAASVRTLLECGADADISNQLGHTPLTIALLNPISQYVPGRRQEETSLDAILSTVRSLRISDHDVVAVAQSWTFNPEETIPQLLNLDRSTVFHEDTMCHMLSSQSYADILGSQSYPNILGSQSYAAAGAIKLLMSRMGGIGVTDRMLKCVSSKKALKALLDCTAGRKVTTDVLLAQENVACMELLLNFDRAAPATQEILLRDLELYDFKGDAKLSVLAELFKRNPELCVTQNMLQAADYAALLEILLSHFRPAAGISEDTLDKIITSTDWQGQEILRLLLKHDPSILVSDKIVLQSLKHSSSPVDALELLLDHQPSIVVTPEIFLLVWKKSREDSRLKVPKLLEKHGKRVIFTDEVRAAIDQAYQLTSEASKKERVHRLRASDEEQMGHHGTYPVR